MYRIVAAFILSALLSTPALAALNDHAHIRALVHCDRAKRSWKFGKLIPGKVTMWYYEWVLEDGSTVTKLENAPIKGVPDERPLKESHPDFAIAIPVVQIGSGCVTSGFVATRAKL